MGHLDCVFPNSFGIFSLTFKLCYLGLALSCLIFFPFCSLSAFLFVCSFISSFVIIYCTKTVSHERLKATFVQRLYCVAKQSLMLVKFQSLHYEEEVYFKTGLIKQLLSNIFKRSNSALSDLKREATVECFRFAKARTANF